MRLEFQLLVVDDNRSSVDGAIAILQDHLETLGFALRSHWADDFTERGIRDLARQEGRNYDLVIVDYNLGSQDINGAMAAAKIRVALPYTDIIFYSSDQSANLLDELAKQRVAGVFVSGRRQLDDDLVGIAGTIIRKAVDLSHMRGIAMAEVAEMDVLMEEILERAFSSDDAQFREKAIETLNKIFESAQASVTDLEPVVSGQKVLHIFQDGRLFSSAQKYMALRRVAKCLPQKPSEALEALVSYEKDIILNRNTLAHAKEDTDEAGAVTLRSIKRGRPAVVIDDAWMVEFRAKLRTHHAALKSVCSALDAHLDVIARPAQLEQD
jgi:CheY-like chemotaxis protein